MITKEGLQSNMLLAKARARDTEEVITGMPIMYHDEMQCVFKDFDDLKKWEREHMIARMAVFHDTDFGLPIEVSYVDVYPNTVCRTTGLICNHRWLYEHDIVEDSDDNRWEVVWNKPNARWSLSMGDLIIDISEDSTRQLRIVGNTVLDKGESIE